MVPSTKSLDWKYVFVNKVPVFEVLLSPWFLQKSHKHHGWSKAVSCVDQVNTELSPSRLFANSCCWGFFLPCMISPEFSGSPSSLWHYFISGLDFSEKWWERCLRNEFLTCLSAWKEFNDGSNEANTDCVHNLWKLYIKASFSVYLPMPSSKQLTCVQQQQNLKSDKQRQRLIRSKLRSTKAIKNILHTKSTMLLTNIKQLPTRFFIIYSLIFLIFN